MPFLRDDAVSESNDMSDPPAPVSAGTVLKPFHGPTRRFPVDYVVTDADAADLPIGADALKAKGFIA